MQPVSGDTYAIWIADDGLDRAHDAELLIYSPPATAPGDVSAVWISADGYQWSYDDQLQEVAFTPVGTAAITTDDAAASASGDVGVVITGTASIASQNATASATAEHLPNITGTTSITADNATASGAGFFVTQFGTAAISAADATAAAVALYDWSNVPGQTIYDLTLTGAPDGVADITLPLASFQGRMRSGTPSYLQVIVPNAPEYADAVTARPNGQLVIRKGKKFSDGTSQMEEIARVNLERIGDDRGGNKKTMTLSGHRTATVQSARQRTLQGVTYRHAGTGKTRYRARLDQFLRPGDTAVYSDSESITVGLITYIVEPGRQTMEITEA